MNNSKLAIESVASEEPRYDVAPLRAKEAELVNLIGAIGRMIETEEYRFIEKEVFGKLLALSKKSLETESRRAELNLPEVYRLQGQIRNAERHDLRKMLEMSRTELIGVRNQLKIHG